MTYYRERLWPSPWIYIVLALVIPASVLVFMPINGLVGIITGIALYAGLAGLLTATAPLLQVNEHQLVAGRASLPLGLVGVATGFEGAEATLERGQRLDARAWLLIRGWVGPVIRIEVADPTDPTPYWLVSTRHPDAIISAIRTAQEAAASA